VKRGYYRTYQDAVAEGGRDGGPGEGELPWVSGEHDGDHLQAVLQQAARHQRRREPHLPPYLRLHRGAWSGAGHEERRGRRLRRPAGASATHFAIAMASRARTPGFELTSE